MEVQTRMITINVILQLAVSCNSFKVAPLKLLIDDDEIIETRIWSYTAIVFIIPTSVRKK